MYWLVFIGRALREGLALGATLLFIMLVISPVEAAPRKFPRHSDLITPPGLRARVNFWKDVFAKYDRNFSIIHHRAFPQIVFEVVDYRPQASQMDPVEFDRYRRKDIERRLNRYKEGLKVLAQGKPPADEIQNLLAEKMTSIPGGVGKYKVAVKEDHVRSQTGIRDKWVEALQRSGRYLGTMERIFVDEFGLPIELTRLPFVESSFDYTAYSAVGAAGIWQFMPRTARQYRMTVTSVVDERRDPIRATESAARYLSSAYRTLGSWPLAITSYNHGVGGVLKRVREAGTSDIVTLLEHPTERPFGFASSNFFPSFLAAVECYDERKLLFPETGPEPPLRLTEYKLSQPVSAAFVARQLSVPMEDLKRANYALLERVWEGKSKIPAGYTLRVPEEYGVRLASLRVPEAVSQGTAPGASSVYGGATYRIRKGDTLSTVAKRYGVTVSQLKALNDLEDNTVQVGQLLIVKPKSVAARQESAPDAPASSNSAKVKGSASPSVASHKVRPGETLGAIAKKHAVTVDQIKAKNGLASSQIRVGQVLQIPRESDFSGEISSNFDKTHKVKPGDTLWSLAKQYQTTPEEIRKMNKLSRSALRVGQVLKVPG